MSAWANIVAPARAKLRSQAGETLVETLASVLISTLAILLLATAVGSAVRIVASNRKAMVHHYQDETAMAQAFVNDTDPTPAQVTLSVPLETDGATQTDVKIYTSDDGLAAYKGATP